MIIETDPTKVSPQTHRFVGMYRPPMQEAQGCLQSRCPLCNESFGAGLAKIREHWLAGHFDVPQYKLLAEQSRPIEFTLRMDEHEWSNLRSALLAVHGFDYHENKGLGLPSSPLQALNSGDWLGQLLQRLTPVDWAPNVTPAEYVRRANYRATEWRKVWDLCVELGMKGDDQSSQWECVERFLREQCSKLTLSMDQYEWGNLRSALLAACGYDYQKHECLNLGPSPLQVLNSGDWLGQLLQRLTPVDHPGNASPQEYADRARKWKSG